MADEMGLSLQAYRMLERGSLLEHGRLREATFAALRIAVEQDGNPGWQNTELFETFEELLKLFALASHQSGTVH